MGKQIAVLMCAINLDNQRKILEGMIDAAKETDANLFVFTNYVSATEENENVRGAYRIMELPDFKQFDAAILVLNTLHYRPAVDYSIQAIKESGIPAVSIDNEIEGMGYIGISSYEAEYELIEHFITEHNCRDIYYVRGPIRSKEAQKRYQAYCDVLQKYNIPLQEDHVYLGMFNLESGREAAKYFLKNGKTPSCIICANDAMAVGVAEILKNSKYRIPEEVRIAGFDNGETSYLHIPPITTIDKSQYDVGYQSVMDVLAQSIGKAPEKHEMPCKLETRGSCGCDADKTIDVEWLKGKYISDQMTTLRMSDIVRNMTAQFSGLETPQDIIVVLKDYIVQTELESFYLCLCERDKVFCIPESNIGKNIDIQQVNETYTEQIELALAYENGKFESYPTFEKGLVLPKECKERSGGNYFIITPVYFQKCCYGYCITQNTRLPLEHSLYYSWIMNIGVALENVRKLMLLQDAVVRLNSLWSYDLLTNLHNRAGFFYEAKAMIREMKAQNKQIFLLFMDIDGLKPVNDTYGHDAGDDLIREMAWCIKKNLNDGMLAMRYGGDEFVILGSSRSGKKAEMLVNAIRNSIRSSNQEHKYPFRLSASIGVIKYQARDIEDLTVLIEQADIQMYEEKRRKKARIKKKTETSQE